MAHLIIDALNLVEEGLGAQHLSIILFEVDSLVVQGLQVILFVLLTPDLIKASLCFSPLLLLQL